MKSGPTSIRGVASWLTAMIAILLVSPLLIPVVAWGGGLRGTVKDLWGGDGITLQPPPSGSGAGGGGGGGGGTGTGGGGRIFSHSPHFTVSSLRGLDNLNAALASNLGLFALNSTVTGFTFDIERGVPVRTTESLGPLLAERAPTLGAGRLNLGLAYTRINFTRFEGQKLGRLSLDFVHEDTNQNGRLDTTGPFSFEADAIRADLSLDISEDVFALFATYGLTRSWDVGVVVPIVHVRFRATGNATILRNSDVSASVHNFGPDSDPPRSSGGGDETGIGDVLLRTKYNLVRNRPGWPDLAVLGQVKLPTGDEDKLLGTGDTRFQALLVASRSFGWLTPHANVGYEISTGSSKDNNLRYVAGADVGAHPRLTFAIDVLGRWEPDGDGVGDHIVDLAVGVKWNPLGAFVVNAGVQLPLNRDEGLRADVIWTVGLEFTF